MLDESVMAVFFFQMILSYLLQTICTLYFHYACFDFPFVSNMSAIGQIYTSSP